MDQKYENEKVIEITDNQDVLLKSNNNYKLSVDSILKQTQRKRGPVSSNRGSDFQDLTALLLLVEDNSYFKWDEKVYLVEEFNQDIALFNHDRYVKFQSKTKEQAERKIGLKSKLIREILNTDFLDVFKKNFNSNNVETVLVSNFDFELKKSQNNNNNNNNILFLSYRVTKEKFLSFKIVESYDDIPAELKKESQVIKLSLFRWPFINKNSKVSDAIELLGKKIHDSKMKDEIFVENPGFNVSEIGTRLIDTGLWILSKIKNYEYEMRQQEIEEIAALPTLERKSFKTQVVMTTALSIANLKNLGKKVLNPKERSLNENKSKIYKTIDFLIDNESFNIKKFNQDLEIANAVLSTLNLRNFENLNKDYYVMKEFHEFLNNDNLFSVLDFIKQPTFNLNTITKGKLSLSELNLESIILWILIWNETR